MKKVLLLIVLLMPMLVMAAENDTLILQQGKDGYTGCVDLNNTNDHGTTLFGNQISTTIPNLFVSNYRC